MYKILIIMLLLMINPSITKANTECDIEDFSFEEAPSTNKKMIRITGTTTCKYGRVSLRVYDKHTKKYIGSELTYTKGNIFLAYVDVKYFPTEIDIKYTIEIKSKQLWR